MVPSDNSAKAEAMLHRLVNAHVPMMCPTLLSEMGTELQ
jgi:hypothetical protein